MKVAHIICDRYFSEDGTSITIGGMQSYFTRLAEVLLEEGFRVNLYHIANVDFEVCHNNIHIKGYKYNKKIKYAPKYLYKLVSKNINQSNDIVIFGSEAWIVKTKGIKSIAIQHGIPWDIPCHYEYGELKYWLYYCYKAFKAFINIKRVNLLDQIVCVDYNYVNWYRALVAYPKTRLHVIPNFSEILADSYFRKDENIQIIFARRLWQYRGTRIFAYAVQRILEEYPNVYVTIAGDGPDEGWLKRYFESNDRVSFVCYESNLSLEFHKNMQIAVVPTIGSEGTSLALLEAMAAKCAVICSNVGGLTNIIIDGYNGMMIPNNDIESLYNAIKYLIENLQVCELFAERGYETVESAFSLSTWKMKWKSVINTISRDA